MMIESSEHDGGNLATVIVLAMVLGAAIAEEAGFLAIGANPEVVDRSHPGALKPRADIPHEVEMRIARAFVG